MKRSERIKARASYRIIKAITVLVVSIAAAIWSASVALCTPLGGVAMLAVALAGLSHGIDQILHALEERRYSAHERTLEIAREIRPRL